MNDDTTPREKVIQNWLIRRGDTKNADHWAKQLGTKLLEGKKLSPAESSTLASILLSYAERGEAAKLFNKGKMPNLSNRFLDDYTLYEAVEKHKTEGMTRREALKQAGEDLNLPRVTKGGTNSTLAHRYDSVVKSIKEVFGKLDGLKVALALGGRAEELKELYKELDSLQQAFAPGDQTKDSSPNK